MSDDGRDPLYVVVFNGMMYGPFAGMKSAAEWLAETLVKFSSVRNVSIVPMVNPIVEDEERWEEKGITENREPYE